MPTYEYKCKACSHRVEYFQSITERPKRKCPRCMASKLERLIGSGAAILFKGSGFYQTDYRSDSYRQGEKSEKPATEESASSSKEASSNADGASAPQPKKPAKKKAPKDTSPE
jgi:putative FmdB family regulatory protein